MPNEELQHYGVKRRSGRYPYGSGKDPQRSQDILSKVDKMKAQGMSEPERAKALGMSVNKLRSEISWANESRKQSIFDEVQSRVKRGESNSEIARQMGLAESTVRNYKKHSTVESNKQTQLDSLADELKKNVDNLEYVDIGAGVNQQLGVSSTKLKAAVEKLKEEGYYEHQIYVKQIAGGKGDQWTTINVLTKEPDKNVVSRNKAKIQTPDSQTDDGGFTFHDIGLKPIKNVDWDRVGIVYGDKGGEDRDGLMLLRKGTKDLDLGEAKYAQVRIGVGGTHYLKGMAMYADESMPKGKDILFYTNKKSGTPKEDVLKPLKDNPDNPFGATIKKGGQRGALNIVNEEGDWHTWSSSLSSQFLSKQPLSLVKERINTTIGRKRSGLDEILALNNPVVKKHLLDAYADELDSAAVNLKAAGLPKTKSHVILPYPNMKANEVYAPNYKDGERVVLVRYPHGGTFELPELTVNNKGPARKTLGQATDAIGIHPSVARKLSGADFDGDTVTVIPNNKGKIKTSRSLKELENFDPNMYKVDHATITPRYKQTQMGIVSNLITDMTIKGASPSELARAVKHSMVVIDAEKHKLDYKRSARANSISALQRKYQTHISKIDGKKHTGASTIISRSKQEVDVYNPKTKKTEKKKLITMLDDANKLSSGTKVEKEYAAYANTVKKMAQTARNESAKIKSPSRNPEAAKLYSKQVKSLDAKLSISLSNAPRERKAQILANEYYRKNVNQDMDKDQKKKLRGQALAYARDKANAKRTLVDITPKEWEAIQAGAISKTKLEQILRNTDMDKVKKLATPKAKPKLTPSKQSRASTLLKRGYTYAEVADSLGISVSTLRNAMTPD